MNTYLFIAGLLAAVGTAIHAFLPEIALFRHASATTLPRPALPRFLRFLGQRTEREDTVLQWRCLRASWHFLTVDIGTSAVLLVAASAGWLEHGTAIAGAVALRFAGYACLWFVMVAARHRNVFCAPQWILLFMVAGFAYWGAMAP
jgi:hypothetical protein